MQLDEGEIISLTPPSSSCCYQSKHFWKRQTDIEGNTIVIRKEIIAEDTARPFHHNRNRYNIYYFSCLLELLNSLLQFHCVVSPHRSMSLSPALMWSSSLLSSGKSGCLYPTRKWQVPGMLAGNSFGRKLLSLASKLKVGVAINLL